MDTAFEVRLMPASAPTHVSSRESWRAQRALACALAAGLLGSACQGLLGGVELSEAAPEQPPPSSVGGLQPGLGVVLPGSSPGPVSPGTGEQPQLPPLVPGPDSGASANGDAGPLDPGSADPSEPLVIPVQVEPPSPLALVGFEGGGPRLGTCQGGIVMGVRTTANPNTDNFGQRLVFIEPICASAAVLAGAGPPNAGLPGAGLPGAGARIALTRDDALLSWDAAEPMLGPPSWEVPDERLLWVPQPETLCPAIAPALVGLSGEYEPPAADGSVTAILRSLVLECAPLALAPDTSEVVAQAEGHLLISRPDSFAASGSAQYRSACEGGSVLSQLLLHSGFWLDGFVLGCSTLHGDDAAAAR